MILLKCMTSMFTKGLYYHLYEKMKQLFHSDIYGAKCMYSLRDRKDKMGVFKFLYQAYRKQLIAIAASGNYKG